MADDLGAQQSEVHREAAQVLAFWFEELTPEQHWAKDAELDRTITARFGDLNAKLLETGAAGWRETPDTLLAAVIVLDQFSRNIHRGEAAAFAADGIALDLARGAIARGWDRLVPAQRRGFLYLPFMHSEDLAVQDESIALYEQLGDPEQLKFAHGHRDLIVQFGRYPHRNAALGRQSTPAEEDYLSQPGAGY